MQQQTNLTAKNDKIKGKKIGKLDVRENKISTK